MHLHPIVDARCKKTMYEIKKLIKEGVNWTPNAKTSTISLNANKSFLAKYLFNDSDNDNFKLLKGN